MGVDMSPHRTGKYLGVVALSLHKNVTDARLERTSSSADVFIGTPFGILTYPVLRYRLACKVTNVHYFHHAAKPQL